MGSEKTLAERIAEIKIEINEKYPEISKYVEEIKLTDQDEKHLTKNQKNLKEYYDYLIEMVKKYKHPIP